MQIISGPSYIEKFAIDGAGSDILAGALMTRGITDETDRSCAIVSGAAAADALGVLLAKHLTASDSTPEDGAAYSLEEIEVPLPGARLSAEYSLAQADCVNVDGGYNAGTGVATITSLEDDIDGSWLYVAVGAGAGQLLYIKASAAGSCTIKSVTGITALDTTSYVAKILTFGKILGVLTTDRTKLKSTAAIGTAQLKFLYAEFSDKGQGWTRLDPTKHHGKLLDTASAKIRGVFTLDDPYLG
jgi:hypothetical protein